MRGRPVATVLAAHRDGEDPPAPFTVTLVDGVAARRDDLDAHIRAHAHDWSLARMPAVDRNVLRLAVWELLATDVPTGVAIDEAVGLAKELSTEDSGRFVNGLLARIASQRPAD